MVINKTCPNCHAMLVTDTHYCSHCGFKLEEHHDQLLEEHHDQPLTTEELIKEDVPDVIKGFEQTANYVLGGSAALIALYVSAFFNAKIEIGLSLNLIAYALPVLFLLLAMNSACRVFYPKGYLENGYETMAQKKDRRLTWSFLFLRIGIVFLGISLVIYLARPPGK